MKKTFSYAMWSSSTLFTWQVLQPNKTLNKIQKQINYKTNFGTKKMYKKIRLIGNLFTTLCKIQKELHEPSHFQETDRWSAELKTKQTPLQLLKKSTIITKCPLGIFFKITNKRKSTFNIRKWKYTFLIFQLWLFLIKKCLVFGSSLQASPISWRW